MTSFYFEDIFERYVAEIDDLRSDSEGKDVLQRRVRDKHKEFSFLLSMIDAAPEMVAPAFHGAFGFNKGRALYEASQSEPGDDGFPAWADLEESIQLVDGTLGRVLHQVFHERSHGLDVKSFAKHRNHASSKRRVKFAMLPKETRTLDGDVAFDSLERCLVDH